MATAKPRPTLIAIVGPTASGKSDLAMKIAREFNGEIICADSRTVYKGMDIGTAKPSAGDQKLVRHWGLDLVEPGRTFSAAKFKTYAKAAIADIQKRGKLPVLVGGTGLYVDAVLYDFGFVPQPAAARRRELESKSVEQLQSIIKRLSYPMPENHLNRRHLVRVIERAGQAGTRQNQLSANIFLLGLLPADSVLRRRIQKRAQQMFKSGIISETEGLLDHYGEPALRQTAGIIYPITLDLIRSKISKPEAIEQFQTKDWQYARRQKTWFKRNEQISWYSGRKSAQKALQKRFSNT